MWSEVTYQVIGSAMRVHRELGNGFQEVIYQRALAIAMREAGLEFEREKELPIFFGAQQVGRGGRIFL
jgi:GxxExxY protein